MDVDFWNAFSVCPFGLLPHDPSLSHTFFCNYLNQFVHFHLNSFHLHWHKESVYRLSLHSEFQLQFSRFNNVWLHSTIDVWIWIEYHCTLALHFWLYLLLSDKHPENTQCSHKHPEACAGLYCGADIVKETLLNGPWWEAIVQTHTWRPVHFKHERFNSQLPVITRIFSFLALQTSPKSKCLNVIYS